VTRCSAARSTDSPSLAEDCTPLSSKVATTSSNRSAISIRRARRAVESGFGRSLIGFEFEPQPVAGTGQNRALIGGYSEHTVSTPGRSMRPRPAATNPEGAAQRAQNFHHGQTLDSVARFFGSAW